jgi:hypothetical protein
MQPGVNGIGTDEFRTHPAHVDDAGFRARCALQLGEVLRAGRPTLQ